MNHYPLFRLSCLTIFCLTQLLTPEAVSSQSITGGQDALPVQRYCSAGDLPEVFTFEFSEQSITNAELNEIETVQNTKADGHFESDLWLYNNGHYGRFLKRIKLPENLDELTGPSDTRIPILISWMRLATICPHLLKDAPATAQWLMGIDLSDIAFDDQHASALIKERLTGANDDAIKIIRDEVIQLKSRLAPVFVIDRGLGPRLINNLVKHIILQGYRYEITEGHGASQHHSEYEKDEQNLMVGARILITSNPQIAQNEQSALLIGKSLGNGWSLSLADEVESILEHLTMLYSAISIYDFTGDIIGDRENVTVYSLASLDEAAKLFKNEEQIAKIHASDAHLIIGNKWQTVLVNGYLRVNAPQDDNAFSLLEAKKAKPAEPNVYITSAVNSVSLSRADRLDLINTQLYDSKYFFLAGGEEQDAKLNAFAKDIVDYAILRSYGVEFSQIPFEGDSGFYITTGFTTRRILEWLRFK